MRYVYFLVVLLSVASCAPPPDSPDEPAITGACQRAFRTMLEAWEAELGRVPEECAYLDASYDVQAVSAAEMPCDEPVGVNEVRTECVRDGVIYINDELDEIGRIDASVHGWVHAEALCVYGDLDSDHLREPLWEVYRGADSIEVQGQAGAALGKCL